MDAAARTVIARKGILATTISDIATEAKRSAASKLFTRQGLSSRECAREVS
jgi:Bacterial regulatory proteins, tetR family